MRIDKIESDDKIPCDDCAYYYFYPSGGTEVCYSELDAGTDVNITKQVMNGARKRCPYKIKIKE